MPLRDVADNLYPYRSLCIGMKKDEDNIFSGQRSGLETFHPLERKKNLWQ